MEAYSDFNYTIKFSFNLASIIAITILSLILTLILTLTTTWIIAVAVSASVFVLVLLLYGWWGGGSGDVVMLGVMWLVSSSCSPLFLPILNLDEVEELGSFVALLP